MHEKGITSNRESSNVSVKLSATLSKKVAVTIMMVGQLWKVWTIYHFWAEGPGPLAGDEGLSQYVSWRFMVHTLPVTLWKFLYWKGYAST